MERASARNALTALAAAFVFSSAAGPAFAEATVTRTITLRPGWNAVWLDVQPEPRDPAAVFAGVPVESVWAWMERHTAMRYIQNPSEPLWDKTGWNAWRPLEAEPYLSNLYAILAGRAYLVKITGTDPADWTVTGRPSTRSLSWTPDSFNLVGFPVDGAAPPTFGQFMAPSAAHSGQAVYRLSAAGVWEFVDNPAAASIARSEAYWVWCEGASSYQGPLAVTLPGDGLDFGVGLTEMAITLLNDSGSARSVILRQGSPASPEPLAYHTFDPVAKAGAWPPLPLSVDLRTGGKKTVNLAVRREQFTGETFEGVVEINDGAGTLVLVPVTARKPQ